MPAEKYEISRSAFYVDVTNASKRFWDRGIRQRTVVRVEGEITKASAAEAIGRPCTIYLTFELKSEKHEPEASRIPAGTAWSAAQLRIDGFFKHGQEAAILAVLQTTKELSIVYEERADGVRLLVVQEIP